MTTAREDFDQLMPDEMPPQAWKRIGDDLFAKHAREVEAARMMRRRSVDGRYAGQVWAADGGEWRTLVADAEVYACGWKLTEVMRGHGLDYPADGGDAHITSMICGNSLTAPDGTLFRLIAPV